MREKEELREREKRLNNAVEDYRVSYKSPRHKVYSMELYQDHTVN